MSTGTLALQALVFVAPFHRRQEDGSGTTTTTSPGARSSSVWSGIADIWTHPRSTQHLYLLTHTSFWLEWQLFGGRPVYFHAVNLVLHACTAVVCWRILRLVIQRGAWLAAALWAVHPVQVESVAWITERKNVLAGVFASLAVWSYVRGVAATPTKEGASSEEPNRALRGSMLAASSCFVLALTAKSAVAPLPFAMLAAAELRRRRLTAGEPYRRVLVRHAWRLTPLFALGLGAAMVYGAPRECVGRRGRPGIRLAPRSKVARRLSRVVVLSAKTARTLPALVRIPHGNASQAIRN